MVSRTKHFYFSLYSICIRIPGQDSHHDWNDPEYQSNLGDEVLDSLCKIKSNIKPAESPKADMWCHLGTSIIRGPDEGSNHLGCEYFRKE